MITYNYSIFICKISFLLCAVHVNSLVIKILHINLYSITLNRAAMFLLAMHPYTYGLIKLYIYTNFNLVSDALRSIAICTMRHSSLELAIYTFLQSTK